jgi:hypothetical protein
MEGFERGRGDYTRAVAVAEGLAAEEAFDMMNCG